MGKLRPMRPGWTANLGRLIDENIPVRAGCNTCRTFKDVDLPALAEKVGRDFDLWNRRPRCKFTPECTGRVMFYHGGRGRMCPMED